MIMAKATISHELAEKYPEFAGRAGETIDASELIKVQRKHGDAKTTAEVVAEKKQDTPAAATKAPRKRAPAKSTAKPRAKKK